MSFTNLLIGVVFREIIVVLWGNIMMVNIFSIFCFFCIFYLFCCFWAILLMISVTQMPIYWKNLYINTLRPRQNGRHFADDIVKCIFLNENVWTSIEISLKFVPKGPINNIPALVQIMAWHRPGDKPLSEPMMVRLPKHIYVTWPQWVKAKHRVLNHLLEAGGWLSIKIPSYQYRKSHCGDKKILRPSYLHSGISYTGKMTSLYWIRDLDIQIVLGLDLNTSRVFMLSQTSRCFKHMQQHKSIYARQTTSFFGRDMNNVSISE